jgi:hypothetical protein
MAMERGRLLPFASPSVRVLQRNRTERMHILLLTYFLWELTHVIMEAEKSHNLLSVSCRIRKASDVIWSGSEGRWW